ncbi:MAG: (2Fe-2S)-binding protein, partial [Candidatus Eremiobacteraeota bacterium]|nr:(2Fe-2S)-binding protein [Candidatus Eremiobacteraeota bacterium]
MSRRALSVNGRTYEVTADDDTPLLWVIRDEVGLTGTKFGCGMAQCGACTVLLDGNAIRSCVFPLSAVGAAKITTIEGIGASHPGVQDAWIAEDVPQCGYCQSGMMVEAAGLLAKSPDPTD